MPEPLKPRINPLLTKTQVDTVDVGELDCPATLIRGKRDKLREMRDLRRRETAAEAIRGLNQANEIYGFTKGQFSLLDLLVACLELTGPAHMSLSTWTAARAEIQYLDKLQRTGKLLSARWLVDFTFARRDPEAANQIRTTFGLEAIRVAQTHSKFCLFTNDDWKLVIRTSMNLNMNPRFEDFTISHDPELAEFLGGLLDTIWRKQKRTLADATPQEFKAHFREEM